jgi:hypothetical protein
VPRSKITAAAQLVDTHTQAIHSTTAPQRNAPAQRRKVPARPRLPGPLPSDSQQPAAGSSRLSSHPALCRRIHHSLRPLPSPGRTTLRVDLDLAAPRIIKVAIHYLVAITYHGVWPGLPLKVRDRLHRESKPLSLPHRVATLDNLDHVKHTACAVDYHGRPAAHCEHGRANRSES